MSDQTAGRRDLVSLGLLGALAFVVTADARVVDPLLPVIAGAGLAVTGYTIPYGLFAWRASARCRQSASRHGGCRGDARIARPRGTNAAFRSRAMRASPLQANPDSRRERRK